MLEVKVQLTGWADTLMQNDDRKVKFALQLAIHEVLGDCDWDFEVETEGKMVCNPFTVKVKARRCCMYGYLKHHEEGTYQVVQFGFKVVAYTLANVYQGAKEALLDFKRGTSDPSYT